jgi:Mg2+/Co2+ transporter CorB
LLFLSAILSASETAILGSSKIRLHNMVKEGNKQAKVVVKLRRNMGQVISSILIGNTILNIAAGSTATIIMVGFFGEIGAAYATVLMSLLIIFFVEVIPKLYAVNHPEKTAMYVSRILRPLTIIMLPIYMVLEYLAKKTFALFGVTPDTSKLSNTAEELRGMIELHEGPGEEVIHEKAMLRSILDLATVDVGDIMIHRRNVFMLDINSGVENIVQKIKESPHTRVPLWRENPDNVVGILHAKMLFRALQNNNNDFSKINIYEVATSPWFIPETTNLFDQLQAFRRRREHFSVVVDEYGVLLGVVTLEDILEEIVGEIVDEHDIEIPGVRVGQDGAIVVLGTVTIRDLNRQFHWELPDEEASTIAGLILFETRQIPDVGQVFNIRGFKVEILRRERNQITLVKISPPIDEPDHS